MKKIFLLLVLAGIGGVIYFVFFHKAYEKDVVPKSANTIIVLDVKNIMQSVIWQKVNGADEWNIKGSGKKLSGLDKAVKIPDYVFIFHPVNQPAGAFYAIFEIASEKKWQAFLTENELVQTGNVFSSAEAGIDIIKNEQKILLGFTAGDDKKNIQQVANEIFEQKTFTAADLLQKLVAIKNHATIWFDKNETLTQEALIAGNIEEDQVYMTGFLQPIGWQNFAPTNFDSIPNSVLTFGVANAGAVINQLLPSSAKESINKVLNVNVDSLPNFDKTNLFLNFVNVQAKKDTISTTVFDDNFNEVKKDSIQEINEPNFLLQFFNMSLDQALTHFQKNGSIVNEKNKMLFTPMPFVKTWAETDPAGNFVLRSNNFKGDTTLHQNTLYLKKQSRQQEIVCFFLQPYLLNPSVKPYLPIWMAQNLEAIQSIQINLQKQQDGLIFDLRLVKRKNQ